MTKGNQFARALALSTALSVIALGATTTAADAALDPGKSQGKSQERAKSHDKKPTPSKGASQSSSGAGHGQAKGHDKGDDHPSSNGHSNGPSNGQGHGNGSSQGGSNAGQNSTDHGPKDKGGKGGDPAGNNGTVKITPHGEVDGIPQNTPHVGCDFDVEWYGFDEGADIISTVTFEAWSPTRGTLEVVQGDLSVFVGGDSASGAGTDSGFDGEEYYKLAFPGIEPHPKQGYHVKLTINTPGSQGADTKHKVFWVSECAEPETPPVEPPVTPEEPPVTPEEPPTEPETPEVGGEEGNDDDSDVEVLGAQANGAQGAENLPTAVDAGLHAATWVASPTPMPLFVALFGAILAGLGLLVRRRFN